MRRAVATWLLCAACPSVACLAPDARPEPPAPSLAGMEPAVASHLRELRRAVLAEPRRPETWGRLGLGFDAHGLVEDARRCYAEARRLEPRDPSWPYLEALARRDGSPEVVDLLERALALGLREAPVHQRLGEALLALDRLAEARQRFREALERDPTSHHALLGLARVALRQGDPERARSLLERAAVLEPRHRAVHALRSRAERALGDAAAADRAAAVARSLSSDVPLRDPLRERVEAEGRSAVHFAIRGARLLEAGRAADAVPSLRRAVGARPRDTDYRVTLAQALVLAGEAAEARELLRETIAQDPDNPKPKRTLTALLVALGEREEASALCAEVLAMVPGDEDLRRRCAALSSD